MSSDLKQLLDNGNFGELIEQCIPCAKGSRDPFQRRHPASSPARPREVHSGPPLEGRGSRCNPRGTGKMVLPECNETAIHQAVVPEAGLTRWKEAQKTSLG